jgi:hypothetical protein
MLSASFGALHEYSCHTGQRLGLETMITGKRMEVDRALNVALSQSEELSAFLQTALAEDNGDRRAEIEKDLARRDREQKTLREMLWHSE